MLRLLGMSKDNTKKYQTEKLKAFIATVRAELEAVIEKHQAEFIAIAKSEVPDGEYICSGMGSISRYTHDDDDDSRDNNEFIDTLSDAVWGDDFRVCFGLPYMFSNKHVLTDEIEEDIKLYVRRTIKTKEFHNREEDAKAAKLANQLRMTFLKTGKLPINKSK